MKKHHVFEFPQSSFTWIDFIDPSEKDLKTLAKQYQLDKKSVLACLDPQYLPKFEKYNLYNFLILRYYDSQCSLDADTVQELTRKIAIFSGNNFLISIHRQDSPFLQELRKKWSEPQDKISPEALSEPPSNIPQQIFFDILSKSIESYEQSLDLGTDELEEMEMGIFSAMGASPFKLEKAYYLKRRASVFKRILRANLDVLPKLSTQGISPNQASIIKDFIDKLYFYADELNENITILLNLYLSLSAQKTNEASHRTNEVVRLLTVVSLFFLPLNFIVGIYGMNFEFMPELKWQYGYYAVLAFMLILAVTFFLWFRKKGWLKY